MNSLFEEEKIVHRDLKPQNILLNEYGRAYITDVGVAKKFEEKSFAKLKATINTYAGDRNWMAPEMIQALAGQKVPSYLAKLDIFSLGLITLNAIDKDNYNKQKNKLNIDENILKIYLDDVEARGLITDKEFFSMLKSMLSYDIDLRISIQDLYNWMVILIKSIIKWNF